MKKIILKEYRDKSDILFKDFEEFTKIQEEIGLDDISELDEQILQSRLLKIFYNINPSEQRDLQQSQIELLVNKLLTVISQPKSKFKNIIVVDGKKFGFIPNFEKITSGELIDMDHHLSNKNYIALTSLLYRPIIGDVNSNGEYRIVEYSSDVTNNNFEYLTLDIVEGYIEFFYKLLSEFKSFYPTFYAGNSEDGEEGFVDDEVSESNSPFDNGNDRKEFVDYYGPYLEMVYIITNGNLLDADKVYKMDAHTFLYYSEYLIAKRNLETKEEELRNKIK